MNPKVSCDKIRTMVNKVRDYMKENNLILPKDQIVVGLSGGADSVFLLIVLNELKAQFDIKLEALTINHMLRPEAEAEVSFVKNLCEQLDIPLMTTKVDVKKFQEEKKLGTEEAARILRYQVFQQEIEKGKKIALAHHKNDQAETVLFHLFRGSDIKGLRGMEPQRDAFIRPLLCVSRDEIETFLNAKGISFVTDESNFDVNYRRNRIRHDILNVATESICDQSVEHICDTATSVGLAVDFLETQTKTCFNQFVVEENEYHFTIIKEDLLGLHPYLQSALIYEMLWRLCGKRKDISRVHVESVCNLAKGQSGKKADLIYQMEAFVDQSKLHIYIPENASMEKALESEKIEDKKDAMIVFEKSSPDIERGSDNQTIVFRGREFRLRRFDYKKEMGIPDDLYTKWFDYDKITSSIYLRTRQSGDYLYCSEEAKKKLKDYFINEKISVLERDEIPLFADEHHVMWVVGHRISAYYKVTDETRKVLEIQEVYHG